MVYRMASFPVTPNHGFKVTLLFKGSITVHLETKSYKGYIQRPIRR